MPPAPAYENIKVEVVGAKKNVGLIRLDRPKALNALCNPLFVELGKAVVDFDKDESIAAIIITGVWFMYKKKDVPTFCFFFKRYILYTHTHNTLCQLCSKELVGPCGQRVHRVLKLLSV